MFNPEKLLGGLIRSGMRGKGLGSLATGGAALGFVGVAVAAAEHYMNRPQNSSSGGPPPSPSVPDSSAAAGDTPPPPPGRSAVPPPPPGGGHSIGASSQHSEAVLLIRAMIAAANADGVIDVEERSQILEKLKSVALSKEEHQFIVHELLEPKNIQEIVDAVKGIDLSQQVYAASVLAITVDTDAEKQYLYDLAEKLGLDSQIVESIHEKLAK